MLLYRIVQDLSRSHDLSGTGAWRFGGRWNSKGTFMLYTSENSSLALLESIVHFDPANMPPELYLMEIELDRAAHIYTLPDIDYPKGWNHSELMASKNIGDRLMQESKHIAIRVCSTINPENHNLLLNPLYPGYEKLVKVVKVNAIEVDERFRNQH